MDFGFLKVDDVDIDQGKFVTNFGFSYSSTVTNPKLLEMKNENKNYFGFLIPIIW